MMYKQSVQIFINYSLQMTIKSKKPQVSNMGNVYMTIIQRIKLLDEIFYPNMKYFSMKDIKTIAMMYFYQIV